MNISEQERQSAVTVYPAGYEFDEELDEKLEQEKSEFDKFKDEIHDANDYAKISVSKKQTDSSGRPIGKNVFDCFECGIEDYTFTQLCERIRSDFGTGLYQIIGRDSKGKYKFKKVVGVAAPKSQEGESSPGNNVGVLIDKFSDALERQAARTEQLFSNIAGPQTGGDAFDQMTKMMSAMGAMMGAMGLKTPEPLPQKTMLENMQEMAMMKEILETLGGGNSSDGNIFGLLTETVKNIGPLLGVALAAGQKDGTVNKEGIIAPQPRIENPDKETTMQTEQEKLNAMLPQLKFLHKQADGGAKPQDVAEFALKAIPDDHLENIEEFLSREDCIEKCKEVFPPIAEYEKWLIQWQTEMLNGLAQILDDGGAEDTDLTGDDKEAQTSPDSVAGNDGAAEIEESGQGNA